jgi:hypothetical protein
MRSFNFVADGTKATMLDIGDRFAILAPRCVGVVPGALLGVSPDIVEVTDDPPPNVDVDAEEADTLVLTLPGGELCEVWVFLGYTI